MTDEEKLAAEQAAQETAAKAKEDEAAKAAAAARDELKGKSKTDDDDKKKVDDDAAKLLREVMKLKERAKEAEAAKKALEDKYGSIDLEAAKEALKRAEEAEEKELERKGEYERLLEKQRLKAEALVEAERERVKSLQSELEKAAQAVNELSLSNAFANSKFIQEKLALTPNKTKALYASHFEIEEGRLVAYDKPKGAADRTPLIDGKGTSMSFDEAMEEIINGDPDKEYLLKADLKAGAGSKQTTVTTSHTNDKKYDSPLDKIAAGLKNPKNFGPENLKI